MFLSGKTEQFLKYGNQYGYMMPYRDAGREIEALIKGCKFMIDNGAFSGKFNKDKWIRRMKKMLPFVENCLGVISPDAVHLDDNNNFVMGDWEETKRLLYEYSPIIKSLGYPVAYALQDHHPYNEIPWKIFDTLFIAGTTTWKISADVERICLEARRQGKWVHIGRASSYSRIRKTWFADSWDSTTFRYGKKEQKHRLITSAMKDNKIKYNQLKLI